MHPKFIAVIAGFLTLEQTDVFMSLVQDKTILMADVRYTCPLCGASWWSNCEDLACCCDSRCEWNPNLEV